MGGLANSGSMSVFCLLLSHEYKVFIHLLNLAAIVESGNLLGISLLQNSLQKERKDSGIQLGQFAWPQSPTIELLFTVFSKLDFVSGDFTAFQIVKVIK